MEILGYLADGVILLLDHDERSGDGNRNDDNRARSFFCRQNEAVEIRLQNPPSYRATREGAPTGVPPFGGLWERLPVAWATSIKWLEPKQRQKEEE